MYLLVFTVQYAVVYNYKKLILYVRRFGWGLKFKKGQKDRRFFSAKLFKNELV
jgi:hypothetical protein